MTEQYDFWPNFFKLVKALADRGHTEKSVALREASRVSSMPGEFWPETKYALYAIKDDFPDDELIRAKILELIRHLPKM